MENKNSVSVIIPNYNHARYLSKRIDSVLQQTYRNIEVIILDDCSQDESRELIQQYAAADDRITYYFNEKNSKSVFKQWRKGLSMATGRYVWIAESDDYAELDFLATLVPALEQDPSVSFAYSNSLIVDENGQRIEEISAVKHRYFGWDHWNTDFVANGADELRQYLSLHCTVNNASAVVFRRCSIDAAGGIDATFRYTGDWKMYIKLCLQGRIFYTARCLNNYREHAVNASKKSFGDGSQLFERQKCFAFSYGTGVLDEPAVQRLLKLASVEFLELQYHLIGKNKNFKKLVKVVYELCKLSPAYFLQVQGGALKTTNLWKKISPRKAA